MGFLSPLCVGTSDHLCTCGMLSSVTPNLIFGDRQSLLRSLGLALPAGLVTWQAPEICLSAYPSSGATGSPPFLLESKSGPHDCPVSSLPTEPLVNKFRTLNGRRQIIPHFQVLLNVRSTEGQLWFGPVGTGDCLHSSVPGTEFWVEICGGPPDPAPPGPS